MEPFKKNNSVDIIIQQFQVFDSLTLEVKGPRTEGGRNFRVTSFQPHWKQRTTFFPVYLREQYQAIRNKNFNVSRNMPNLKKSVCLDLSCKNVRAPLFVRQCEVAHRGYFHKRIKSAIFHLNPLDWKDIYQFKNCAEYSCADPSNIWTLTRRRDYDPKRKVKAISRVSRIIDAWDIQTARNLLSSWNKIEK